MPIYVYHENEWRSGTVKVYHNNSYVDAESVSVYIDGEWRQVDGGAVAVPSGLIVPFKGSTVPDGWTALTISDKYIVGADETYSVGSYGNGTPLQLTTSATGDHTIGTISTHYGSGLWNRGYSTAGSHSHTITVPYVPPYVSMRFIKASADMDALPSGVVVLSWDVDFSNVLTRENTNGFLRIGSAVSSGGSNSVSGNTNASGTHAHGTWDSNYDFTTPYYVPRKIEALGSHSHSYSFTLTENIKKAMLMAFSVANQFVPAGGMIAFWDSGDELPQGWAECNGQGGTPDLRGYFVYITSSSTGKTGDNTVTVPAFSTDSNSWTHNHQVTTSGAAAMWTTDSYHGSGSVSHSHSVSSGSYNFVPPWFALRIVMKVG